MKKVYTLIILAILGASYSFGQTETKFDAKSRFYLGFNSGITYHTYTEVDFNSMFRGAGGFTFGYSFKAKPTKVFSWDLQLRYLKASYKGNAQSAYNFNSLVSLDILGDGTTLNQINLYAAQYGKYAPNFHTWVNDWSLELKLNTNRLRLNTGWNIFVLGGIGYNRYTTKVDFYQENSNSIKPESDWYKKPLFNSDYETKLAEKSDWMASFGLGIERQLTPGLAISFLHRTTWTRHNDFDGLVNEFNSGQVSNVNDRYHITTGGLKFYLNSSKKEKTSSKPVVSNVKENKGPVVRFTQPKQSPITVNTNQYNLTGIIHHVNFLRNVKFTQNGQLNTRFTYDVNTDLFQAVVNLVEGENKFVIYGENEFGKAMDETIILYNKESLKKPEVSITNPSINPFSTTQSKVNISANVKHITSSNDIRVTLNGQNISKFTFDNPTQKVSLTAGLNLGENKIIITVKNKVGTATDNTIIIYKKPDIIQPPIVEILSPNISPYTSSNVTIPISAKVLYVDSRQNISISVNGKAITNFSYNIQNKIVNLKIGLKNGSNVVEVTGVNKHGKDQASSIIIYNVVTAINPPIVSINYPSIDNKVFSFKNVTIKAQVLNVSSKKEITVLINGGQTDDFSFNSATKLVNIPVVLNIGSNSIRIIAKNQDGKDTKARVVKYKVPLVLNPPTVKFINPASSPFVTNNINYNLQAITTNINNKNQINFKQNGLLINSNNYTFSNGIISFLSNLQNGSNVFQVIVSNNAGSDSKTTIINFKLPNDPCIAPTVGYVAPQPNSVVNIANQMIEAQINNFIKGTFVELTLNGISQGQMIYNNSTQIAKKAVLLRKGVNTLVVKVKNKCGDNKSTFNINYQNQNPCIVPAIKINSLASTKQAAYSFNASVIGVSNSNQISLKLNGISKQFNFNQNTKIITSSLTLKKGTNIIEMSVANSCGSDQSTFNVLAVICAKPQLVNVSKAGINQTTKNNSVQISGQVSGDVVKNNISVVYNGKTIPFSFNTSTKVVSATINSLIIGQNLVSIKAVNSCGKDELKYIITKQNCIKPIIKVVNPVLTVSRPDYKLTVSIANISAKANASVKLNGTPVLISFNTQSKLLISSFKLSSGINKILISANNLCGTVTKTISINANLCTSPQLTTISPKTIVINTDKTGFSAQVSTVGISDKKHVRVTNNGQIVSFSFISFSNQISLNNIPLKLGLNTIKVNATNLCGSEDLIYKITRNACEKPIISLINKISTTDKIKINFSATVTKVLAKNKITIKVNGVSMPFSYDLQTKKVVGSFNLRVGKNTIVVEAINSCGITIKSTIINSNPCVKPSLIVSIPKTTAVSTKASSYKINAIAKGVNSKNEITVTLNGKPVAFVFAAFSKTITINLNNLVVGSNTVVVSVNTLCGSSRINYKITRKPCLKPVINAGGNSMSVLNANYSFKAVLYEVASKNDITLKLNGISKPFNFQNKTLTSSLVLKTGNNTIEVIAKNICGLGTKKILVNYNSCKTPNVIAGYPTNLNITTSNSTFVVTAKAFNVANSNEVSVMNNGKTIPFTYSAVMKEITVSVTSMTSGVNNIEIKAKNSCGSSAITYVIQYQKPENSKPNSGNQFQPPSGGGSKNKIKN